MYLKIKCMMVHQLFLIVYSIGNLKHLQRLNIFGNNFTTVPDSIGNLKHLQTLYIYSDNWYTAIPRKVLKKLILTKKNLVHFVQELKDK